MAKIGEYVRHEHRSPREREIDDDIEYRRYGWPKCSSGLGRTAGCEGRHHERLPSFVNPQGQRWSKPPSMSGHSPVAIANYWLSDPLARSLLNQQLAQLLRAFLESRRVTDEPEFSFCPLCGEALVGDDQPDIWVKGLRCQGNHSWALRGGRLYWQSLELLAEHSDAVVSRLIAGWLKNDYLKPYLHESVRGVLASSPLCPKDAAG